MTQELTSAVTKGTSDLHHASLCLTFDSSSSQTLQHYKPDMNPALHLLQLQKKKDVTKRNKYIFSLPALKLMKLWTFLLSPRPSLHCHMFGFLCLPASLTPSLLSLPRIKDSLSSCTATWRSPPRMCSSLRRSKQFDNMLLLLPNMVIHIQEQPASRGSLQWGFLPVCCLTKEWREKDVCLFFLLNLEMFN